MSPTTFQSVYGNFEVVRRPATPHLPLQAWDAADEYLLSEALARAASNDARVLVINDQFGALAIALHHYAVCSWSDSYTAHCATTDNFARNHLSPSQPTLLPSTQAPSGQFDLVLWRIPKTWALFQQQARALHACIHDKTIVLAGGMQKHLAQGTLDLLRKLGTIEVLPATKKARVFALQQRHPSLDLPGSEDRPLLIKEYDLQLRAGPNVFARDTFDIGARFFLEQFTQLPRAEHVADLGCGNGILGLRLKQLQASTQIEFFDESYQAVAAAKDNYTANGLAESQPNAVFHIDDALSHYDGNPFDLILCNPPFHQGHVIGDHIAWQMFSQSKRHLRSGGELWIVGNRHLDYHIKLKKIFGNCRQIAANAKFVILAAAKR